MLLTLLLACAPEPRVEGIVVVSLDTLRADRLGAYGSARGLTPNLDRFAAESVVFETAYAQANETLYSHASLFTSRYPSELDRLDPMFQPPTDALTIASVFRMVGWQTAGFVAGGHLTSAFGLGAGFETYDDTAAWGSLRDTGAAALGWLGTRAKDRPFFLFVHGYDTHDRYIKPTPFGYLNADPAYAGTTAELAREPGAISLVFAGRASATPNLLGEHAVAHPRISALDLGARDPTTVPLTDADIAHVDGLYDGAVAWADASFGLLLAALEEQDLLDHVAVVVLSDHGEELGEHGAFNHRYRLDDATLHVPLMVRLPGGWNGGHRVRGMVELVDVAPTLWELGGLKGPTAIRGQSLVPALRGALRVERDAAFSEGALRLLSVRNAAGRLTAEGLAAENPYAGTVLSGAPVDGVSLTLEGHAGQEEPLRRALVARWESLDVPARSAR